jgi:perosamine synthetase
MNAVKGSYVPIAQPALVGNEIRYVEECLRSNWISSRGTFIDRFERSFAEFCNVRHAIACNTGTAALHTALLALDIQHGDEVIMPSLTYIASANVARYCGAEPVFADIHADTWNIDPADVERCISEKTKAIMAVHLFGLPADMAALEEIAKTHGVALIEDAAEAHGATYQDRKVGAIASGGAFSFYGNKIITTGEGGMFVTNNDELASRARLLKGQGQDFQRTYIFPVVGYNYRMTNIEAAIGLAQLEHVESELVRRAAIARRYRHNLEGVTGIKFQLSPPDTTSANWMVSVVLPIATVAERENIMSYLKQAGIETRPFFYPIHSMPPYARYKARCLTVTNDIAKRGLCLPTWSGLANEDIDRVSNELLNALEHA